MTANVDAKEERLAWLMLYTGILGFQHHPGNSKAPLTPEQCAEEADVALAQYFRRFIWQSSEQSSQEDSLSPATPCPAPEPKTPTPQTRK